MNSFKKIALTFSMLAVLAVSAAAQCAGKVIHVQLPLTWNRTSINVLWEGGIRPPITATLQGDWSVFTFPSGYPNEGASKAFSFSQNATNIDAVGNHWIAYGGVNNSRYNITGSRPTDNATQSFVCSNLIEGGITYIYPDPNNSSRTVVSAQPPNAYNFYFLPPNDTEWTLGRPVFVYNDGGVLKKEVMTLDDNPTRCGWYKKTWLPDNGQVVPDAHSLIWLNGHGTQPPNDQVGLLGLDEDPMSWVDAMPTPFNLVTQFGSDRDLFFVPAAGANGWTKTDPGTSGICSYNFAAIIYHRGNIGRGFSRWTAGGEVGVGEGLCRGIVKPELGADGKMVFDQRRTCGGDITDWTEEYFNEAFRSTPSQNVQRCYDMPFQRRPNGLWEFDATNLCEGPLEGGVRYGSIDYSRQCGGANGRYVGGFYPPSLGHAVDKYGDYTAAYQALGRTTTALPPAQTTVSFGAANDVGNAGVLPSVASEWCFDRGWRGGNGTIGNLEGAVTVAEVNQRMTLAGCTVPFADGELRSYDGDGGVPDYRSVCAMNPTLCGGAGWWDYPNWAQPRYFCFESQPANFIYEPGQEFFFRGDDDIWIFINNKLVIDLGGNHMPAPGYVKLDTIGRNPGSVSTPLVPGDEYPINIFFCDRRANGSNIRISTNMYFAQESALSVTNQAQVGSAGAQICITTSGTGAGCANIGSSTEPETKCGTAMGAILDYYMLNRRGDTLWLDPTKGAEGMCVGGANSELVCYGGIRLTGSYPTVDRVIVRRDALFGLQGTYRVYAKIKDSEAGNYPASDPLFITSFGVDANIKAVWGDIRRDDNGTQIRDLGPQVKNVVSGKRVPIGFAAGNWRCDNESSFGSASCPFDVFMAPASEGGSIGQHVRVTQTPDKTGVLFSGLTLYRSEDCEVGDTVDGEECEAGANDEFVIGPSGLLVLWVKGRYDAGDDISYAVNAQNASTHSLTVNVFLPRIKFVNPETMDALSPLSVTKGTRPERNTCEISDVPRTGAVCMFDWVGTRQSRAVAAYDISNGGTNELCTTCNFELTMVSWAEDLSGAKVTDPKYAEGNNIVRSRPRPVLLENGLAPFDIAGEVPVSADEMYAFLKVGGLSQKEETYARWDSLLFRDILVPYPVYSEIFDRDGDGFGDSIRIAFNKKFPEYGAGGIRDSLPNMLEVMWDPKLEPFLFGLGTLNADDQYVFNGAPENNWTYWNSSHDYPGEEGGRYRTKVELDSVIVIYAETEGSFVFSKDIKTHVEPGTVAEVVSWGTFKDPDNPSGDDITTSKSEAIADKIPAIVVRALYEADERNCGSAARPCEDRVTITLSEPVKVVEGISADAAKAPFAYKLTRSRGLNDYDAYLEAKNLPTAIRWTLSGRTTPDTERGDYIVQLAYSRYRESGDTTSTPMGGDSVRFVWEGLGKGYIALTDLVGNPPNPREEGRRLDGANPFQTDNIKIAEIDPDGDVLGDALKDLVGGKDGLFQNVDVDTLFREDKPVTFLPTPETWTADSVKYYYPGSVGQLFGPDVDNVVASIEFENPGATIDSIKFFANAFYHTNLGNYVVESKKLSIKCDDPIFQINGLGDCRTNKTKIYLAWNLKDAKNRWVGTGAYVEIYDFSWEVNYTLKDGSRKKEVPNKRERKIEMLGAKRVRKK